jgi:hypothetical protein
VKLGRLLKAWKAREWVPMKEAWLRVYASLSEDMFLTRRDLKADLLAERLVGAVRRIAKDGTETCIILKPAYCQRLEFPYAWLVEGWQADAQGEDWRFFVRRAELDQHYPIAATPPATATDDMRPPRRRPGPPPDTPRWWGICAEIARRCIDEKTGRVRIPKSEAALADDVLGWLEEHEQGEPSEREMREAVKYICAALRPLQR